MLMNDGVGVLCPLRIPEMYNREGCPCRRNRSFRSTWVFWTSSGVSRAGRPILVPVHKSLMLEKNMLVMLVMQSKTIVCKL
jgi:hypothetical protein